MLVTVITCDVIGSRKVQRVPRHIDHALSKLNTKHRTDLIARFAVTLGDEFQGVLRSSSQVYHIRMEIEQMLRLPIYAGVGIGKAETTNDSNSSHMTGEAFIRSREALNFAKKKKREFILTTGNEVIDVAINSLAQAAQFIKAKQTHRQSKTINLLLENPTITQRKLAAKMRVSPANISKTLKAAGYEPLQAVISAIEILLKEGQLG